MKKLLAIACLMALTTVAQAQNKLPTEFHELPMFIQREVTGIRARCVEWAKEAEHKLREPHPMDGVTAFYLGRRPAILLNNEHVCTEALPGANCHTWGCDVRIYRQIAKDWEKVLDEPTDSFILNVDSETNTFNHAVLGFTYKYVDKCGPQRKACEYLVSWRNGKLHWQKLGSGR